MIQIYLAGGAFEVSYRKFAKKEYGHKFKLIDPIAENGAIVDLNLNKIIHNSTEKEIVELDKHLIDNSDILVAYINNYSAGTSMEILYSFEKPMPTYLIVTPGKNFENDIWLKYHSTKIFFGINECFDYIVNQMELE